MTGKLFGVGIGPGDSELITLKAVKILQQVADVVAVPLMKNGDRTAYDIVKEYIDGKEIMNCPMPMSKDFEYLAKNYAEIADKIEERLLQGQNVAFITLGDPTVYSTYMQINRIILSRGYETELIPGVTSFCAAAARFNVSLCERNQPLIILPASYKETEAEFEHKGTKVLMKASRSMLGVRDMLKQKGLLENCLMVENCGMANERLYYAEDLENMDENSGYFSLLIVKENLNNG